MSDRGLLKHMLRAHIADFGARAVAEELVEAFHDLSGDSATLPVGGRTNEKLRWLRLATKLGNAIHWQNMEWPS